MLTPAQCLTAQAGISWAVRDLASKARVGVTTINRFETGQAASNIPTLAALRRAFEEAGVILIAENGNGPGVQLRKPAAT